MRGSLSANDAGGDLCGHRIGLDAVMEVQLADDPASIPFLPGCRRVDGTPRSGPGAVAGEEGRLPPIGLEGDVEKG